MDRLRRIIIHKSDNGYMFSIKDLGNSYSEAAPVNKVAVNGPADSAGLRSGDGVVAINSNLVKGKTYSDLCNIIKSCRGTSLELTVIENYCGTLQPNKLPEDKPSNSENSTPLSLEECSAEKYSPIVIKKKAYTYDKEALERFSIISSEKSKPYNSAFELCIENTDSNFCSSDMVNQVGGHYKSSKPKISYKKATNLVYKTTAKSDLDINNLGHTSASDSTNSSTISAKVAQYDPTKVVYHQAYKQNAIKRSPNSKSTTDSQQDDIIQRHRRGSTPVISDSSSLSTAKVGRYSQTKIIMSTEPTRKTSRNLSITKSSTQSMGPTLQLNRVGGFVRAPLSVDETLDLDEDFIDDIDSILNSVDTATTDHSSTTAATTESGRSSCDLDTMDSCSKGKFRHIHCSPMPYKSHNIANNSSMSLEITPTTELSQAQLQKYDTQKLKDRPLSTPLANSTPRTGNSSIIDVPDSPIHPAESYHEGLVDEYIEDKDDVDYSQDSHRNHNSKHLKKLKNILGDNYRCRSKTLDSDGKSKDDEVDVKVNPASVFVKWIVYEGKSCKSSWKQYIINIDDDRLVFYREKSQNYLRATSIDDTAMSMSLLNVHIDDEPEKRGRKNTLRLMQAAGKQNESLIEFQDKSLSSHWLRIITERSKPPKDDKESRTASFKERHSLTVPNLYGKDSSQPQFTKSKTKSKDENSSPVPMSGSTNPLSSVPQSNKSVIHQAMSRVKNLKHKFASSGQVSDFERQQEEWFNKTSGNTTTGKLVSSYSYSEDIQGGIDSVAGFGQNLSVDGNDTGNTNSLPLHKWQRSISSRLVPLVVELCVSIIETFGMNHVGLYRVSGNKVALDFISAELRKPLSEIDVSTDKWNDLHAISGVLKSFFRNLPDGLFPKDLYSDIIGACRLHEFDRERRLLSIQRYLSIMDIVQDHPEYRYHRETLRFLAEHLSRVAGRQSTNRMTAKNLAVIFAPSLMKPPQETNQILVNDYRYKIQLMETLIKYHKWLFSPTLESACNIPLDSDDEDTTRNAFPTEESSTEQAESADSWCNEVTDARPLVKKILNSAAKLSSESLGDLDSSQLDYNEFDKNSDFTLAELSKQAYAFNSVDVGFKEVDIDEECEKRKGKVEISALEKLKLETDHILSECCNDLGELNGIQQQCHADLSQINEKIKKVNDEITKTENFLERTKDRSSISPKKVTSQLFEISTRSLSPLSVALASPLIGSPVPANESHKD